ncbi:hypothetical protein AOQ84DRAFT_385997, partial [Glonium stellatum]
MARLNEAPAPAESIDVVKRRFLRQNRELAKTNSTQSIRIRNLETEGSRLLAENLSLREQVIKLQSVLENQSNHPSAENINAVKDKLEAKIQELGSLVAELGQIQKPGPRCKSQAAATRRSPDERNWQNGLGLGEFMDGQDGRLPTISEDKYYPRRTMNADELRDILGDPDSQSPDLGPPPVAHFEDEGPIKFQSQPRQADGTIEQDQDGPNPAISINLETRKKRRDSNAKISIRRMSVFQSPPEGGEEEITTSNDQSVSIRTGAKRKLSAREDEESQETGGEPQGDDFRFSRRNASSASDDSGKDAIKDIQILNVTDRRILGNKPVNTDPILSPKKAKPSISESKPDTKKPTSTSKTSSRPRPRDRRTPIEPLEIPPEPISNPTETAEIQLDSLPPKTPAGADLFSPPSTEPSTARPESKDTPPPTDLNPSATSTDQANAAGRTVRRARAPVNYAEPNLISKMRRPTKELVDAVVPDGRRSTSAQPNEPGAPPPTTAEKEKAKLRTVVIKRERDDGDSGSGSGSGAGSAGAGDDLGEPNSPLSKKTARQGQTQTQTQTQTQEALVDDAPAGPTTLNSSAAAHAISALISASATSRRRPAVQPPNPEAERQRSAPSEPLLAGKDRERERERDGEGEKEKEKEKQSHLAVFDFTDSSPPDAPAGRSRVELAKQARAARRHSSVPASAAAGALAAGSARQGAG